MATYGSRPRVSSNTYACGSNQNCGNVLTDTPSTHVLKPPGGASSFSLGWCNDGDERTNQRRPGGQGWSNDGDEHTSQRRPGGQGTRQPERYGSHERCPEPPYYSESMDGPFATAPPDDACTFGGRLRPSSNNYASGSNQNSGNMLTDVPTTRVNKPPGGASALNLAWGGNDERPNTHHGHQDRREHMEQRQRPQSQPQHSNMHDFEDCQDRVQHYRQPQQQNRMHGSRDQAEHNRQGPLFGQRPRETSNTFARGANQNCGNVISDTPTTRVNAPPGGASTLRLG